MNDSAQSRQILSGNTKCSWLHYSFLWPVRRAAKMCHWRSFHNLCNHSQGIFTRSPFMCPLMVAHTVFLMHTAVLEACEMQNNCWLNCFSVFTFAEPKNDLFLFYGKGRPGIIRGLDINIKSSNEHMLPVEDLVNPRALDYHAETGYIYFADTTSFLIGCQKTDGSSRETILKDGNCYFISLFNFCFVNKMYNLLLQGRENITLRTSRKNCLWYDYMWALHMKFLFCTEVKL